jgi:type I restriction enzyme R subunit
LKLYSGDGDPNSFLLESYEYYVAAYRKQVEDLREIALTADDAGHLYSEEEQRQYILMFRQVAHTLAIIKTFSKFDWADLDMFLDEAEYADYKSWYLTFYDEQEKKRRQGTQTVLGDIDFTIELVRTDKINVVYILNLLKDINRRDKTEMDKAIDLILRELERSDNEKLRYKKDIMKSFITERFFDLDPNEDITVAYEEYEREQLQAAVEKFATANRIDVTVATEILNQYFCDPKQVTKENIRQKILYLQLGLLKTTKLISDILFFIRDMYDKFTAEGV